METMSMTEITNKNGVEITVQILSVIGRELKSANINDVWLLIANSNDNRFAGELLPYNGTTYFLPENQMSALAISPGDMVRLVFSDVLKTVILQKTDSKTQE